MRNSHEQHPIGPPIVRPRTRREAAARKALDSWGGGTETNVAAAIEEGYRDGIKRAAAFIEEKGQRELAMMVRRLAEGTKESAPKMTQGGMNGEK